MSLTQKRVLAITATVAVGTVFFALLSPVFLGFAGPTFGIPVNLETQRAAMLAGGAAAYSFLTATGIVLLCMGKGGRKVFAVPADDQSVIDDALNGRR